MIDNEPPKPGDYRIIENTAHHMGPSWSFRYSVQLLQPGGKFLWWTWPEKWTVVFHERTESECRNYIRAATAGTLGTQVVSYHRGSQ